MKYRISGFSDEISSDIKTQFGVLNKLGIEYFEPRGIDGKNISELNDEEVLLLKENMKKYGIKASSIGSPVGKIKLYDDFEAHFEMYKRIVKIAKELDTKYIRIFSFYHNGEEWSEEEEKEVISRLRRMLEYAAENGVVLLHENEKDIYGDSAERCEKLMKRLYCDNFKAVFDPANFVQCGQDTKKAYELLKGYIGYVHIKDALADGTVVPAGKGDGNVPFILKSLFDNGYDGYLSLEPHLGSFCGLEKLEINGKTEKLAQSSEKLFASAHGALTEILNEIRIK